MFRNGEIIREEWLPLFRPRTLQKILKAEDEDREILDEAKRNTIIEIAVRANVEETTKSRILQRHKAKAK